MTRVALLAALLTGACASSSPAPIAYGGGGERREPARVERRETAPARAERRAQSEQPVQTPERAPVVQPAPNWVDGEGTPLSTYALQPGEAQPFDPAHMPRTHRVGEDESLYDIATRYQVPLRALIDQNHLEPPYALAPGRELQLPPPRIHTVARSESFEDVAQRYHVDLRSLALLNRIQPPYEVRRGDQIVLPAMARELAPFVGQSATAPPQAGEQVVAGSGRFAWPLRGDVVTRFGAQPGGTRIDGIEIAGREGAQVSSAAEGDVVYAGTEVEGYGALILVRHADNYVTAYAYNRRALVREGQHVRAGEAIAELGLRPDGRARLLFQVRRGSEALDPAPLMAPAR